jgi:hypothetical protein
VLCCVFLRIVCRVLPVSLDCPFLIASSVFSNVYLYDHTWWRHCRNSSCTLNYIFLTYFLLGFSFPFLFLFVCCWFFGGGFCFYFF